MHPFQKHRELQASHKRVKHILKQAGGGIDEEIDVSTPGPGQYPYSLGQKMQHARSVMDREEIDAGKRFSDTGTRIPGVGKAKADRYMKERR